MSEIIKNGVPTGPETLNSWNYYKTTVEENSTYGNVFNLAATGFMTQFTYLNGTVSSIQVSIPYRNTGTDTIRGHCVLYAQENTNIDFMLLFEPTGSEFETLSFTLTVDQVQITKAAFEINNTGTVNVLLAQISIDCNIASSSSTSINTSDYIQSAIMFGTDANKPALR